MVFFIYLFLDISVDGDDDGNDDDDDDDDDNRAVDINARKSAGIFFYSFFIASTKTPSYTYTQLYVYT